MKGKDNFYFRGFSLNDISLNLKQKNLDSPQELKVLNSLCSRSWIVPFWNDDSSEDKFWYTYYMKLCNICSYSIFVNIRPSIWFFKLRFCECSHSCFLKILLLSLYWFYIEYVKKIIKTLCFHWSII